LNEVHQLANALLTVVFAVKQVVQAKPGEKDTQPAEPTTEGSAIEQPRCARSAGAEDRAHWHADSRKGKYESLARQ
jgi:hypothetical protein